MQLQQGALQKLLNFSVGYQEVIKHNKKFLKTISSEISLKESFIFTSARREL